MARSIFEEVSETQKPETTAGVIDRGRGSARQAIRAWLMVLAALVICMIIVGGLTRLTDSGLSITEWAPLSGAVPPLSAEQWQAEFDAYRQIPEYQLQNAGMSLAEFKVIYWWEWGHRQLGRVIGLVWALGFVYFLVRRQIPMGWTPKLLFIGALGGLQGAIGWWMVSSGLTGTMLDVASYRLATHLGLAFIILGFIGRYIAELSRSERDLMQARRAREGGLVVLMSIFTVVLFIQLLIGALVAGIDAGRAYNTWPDMNGQFFPDTALDLQPTWRNFFENSGMVQFMHRTWGYFTFAFAVYVGIRAGKSPNKRTRKAIGRIGLLITLMIIIGIATVMLHATLWIAAIHQAVAIALWLAAVYATFLAANPIQSSLRDA
ncbi:MAG: COX15/CtaA family protein [Rhodobacteraceae bacterium]|nr:COX15/CtaA family protein [Paracoccaceae bacterium]